MTGMMASINNTPSSQALMKQNDSYNEMMVAGGGKNGTHSPSMTSSSSSGSDLNQKAASTGMTKSQWFAISILTFINLINYMDRYTIAGILGDVQVYFNITDGYCGALQTVFVASYMVVAPIFGYLGDRYSRRWLMALGVSIWVVAVLAGSFAKADQFAWFMVARAIVGVGEASYSTIAPTLISDMFVKEARSKCLAIFYFAIPVGSGLGYVVGKQLAVAFGSGDVSSWQWALRGTPVLGVIAVLLIIFCLEDPPRGGLEGGEEHQGASSYTEDIKSLMGNGTFVLSTLGFTCVTFCTGALAWWGPKFLEASIYKEETEVKDRPLDPNSVSFYFGLITMVAGIVGVITGATSSTVLKRKYPRADPLICGAGLAACSAIFGLALFVVIDHHIIACLALIFLGMVAINLNWSIVADILLYVVASNRRGTAEAIQILVSHLFGDAGSPYLIGLVSDALKNRLSADDYCGHMTNRTEKVVNEQSRCDKAIEFYSMQYSMSITLFVVAIGAIFFVASAIFVIKDKRAVDNFVASSPKGARNGKAGSPERQGMLTPRDLEDMADDFTDGGDGPPTLVVSEHKETHILRKPVQQTYSPLRNPPLLEKVNMTTTPPTLKTSSDAMYTEIRNGVSVPPFSRLLDSDTSLDSTPSPSQKSSSTNLLNNSAAAGACSNASTSSVTAEGQRPPPPVARMSDADLVRELVQNSQAPKPRTKQNVTSSTSSSSSSSSPKRNVIA